MNDSREVLAAVKFHELAERSGLGTNNVSLKLQKVDGGYNVVLADIKYGSSTKFNAATDSRSDQLITHNISQERYEYIAEPTEFSAATTIREKLGDLQWDRDPAAYGVTDRANREEPGKPYVAKVSNLGELLEAIDRAMPSPARDRLAPPPSSPGNIGMRGR